jgi:hypothetical protein
VHVNHAEALERRWTTTIAEIIGNLCLPRWRPASEMPAGAGRSRDEVVRRLSATHVTGADQRPALVFTFFRLDAAKISCFLIILMQKPIFFPYLIIDVFCFSAAIKIFFIGI